MDLGNRGLGAAPQRHELFGVTFDQGVVHHRVPCRFFVSAWVVRGDFVRTNHFGVFVQVVAVEKSPAFTFNNEDMDFIFRLGPRHRVANVARHGAADGIEFFWLVQAQPGDVELLGIIGNRDGIEVWYFVSFCR